MTFHGDKGSIVSDLHVSATAGSANASLTYAPKTKAYKLHLDAPAIVVQKLQGSCRQRIWRCRERSRSPQMAWERWMIRKLVAHIKLPKLELQQKSIAGVDAEIRVANRQADLTVDSQVAQASVNPRPRDTLTSRASINPMLSPWIPVPIPLNALLATFSNRAPDGFSGTDGSALRR